jgi:hypothetical protein
LSRAFPKITFDADGVCSFCRDEMIATSERAAIARAAEQITELFRTRGPEYDAILCNSGGKDSSYTLKLAVEKYGLRVLSFTLDNGFISDQARENIQRVVDHIGVDHVTVRPSMRVYREIIKAATCGSVYREQTLTRISAGCNSCISLVNMTALRFALEKRVPVILAGFTLGQIPANGIVYRNHYRFLQDGRRESLERLREAVGGEIDRLYTIPESALDRVESYPHNVNLLCLEEITEDGILAEVSLMGWRRPGDVDGCSSNCRLNTFNNFVHERRFGFSPYELELSHLIRKGLMTRDEALAKLADQPRHHLPLLADELALDADMRSALGLPQGAP